MPERAPFRCPSVAPALLVLSLGPVFSGACGEQQIAVLEPLLDAASADAQPVDGLADAFHADSGDCALLLATGEPCTNAADCCSGICDLDPEAQLSCRPATGCLPLGETCVHAGQCCSLACEQSGESSFVCAPGRCAANGTVCATDLNCCSHLCSGSVCVADAKPCFAAGEICERNEDCCGDACSVDAEGAGSCALLQACRVEGELCTSPADCCSGSCRDLTNGVGRCTKLASCVAAHGKSCSRQVGDTCHHDDECCSRVCLQTAQGAKRCAASGGCRGQCELCSRAGECCSKSCVEGADGIARCADDGGACSPSGELCEGPEQCCAEAPECADDPPGVGTRRCRERSGTECRADDTSCTLASQCCGGSCVSGEDALQCREGCRGDGAECTIRADCCEKFSDCLVLEGRRVCAPVIR